MSSRCSFRLLRASAGIQFVVEQILEYRHGVTSRTNDVQNSKYHSRLEVVTSACNVQNTTVTDYADLNIRYLKATGIFIASGRNGIEINPVQTHTVRALLEREEHFVNEDHYLPRLWQGATLPTDNEAILRRTVIGISNQLRKLGQNGLFPPDGEYGQIDEDLLVIGEERLREAQEEAYAKRQPQEIEEIAAWMDAIATKTSKKLQNGQMIKVPKSERPAYLEWIVWRAFLAIDSFETPPWEARRFQIDQDFLPTHCAPGRGPDMMFEFDEFVLVVEVTLTTSSRQEAAEGEPVRRHVADVAENAEKSVFGLFIAEQVDSNTAHTFRAGDWYRNDETKMNLHIVPLTLTDFKSLIMSNRMRGDRVPHTLRNLLLECRSHSHEDAPTWKASINEIVQGFCATA